MNKRLFALLFVCAGCALAQEGFSVVVGADSPAKSISKAQLRRLMMGDSASWAGGAKAVVLLGPAGDSARGAALKQVCGMDEAEFTKHVMQVNFGGGTKPVPKSLPSTAIVKTVVKLTPGAVGIIGAGDASAGLKVLPIE